MLYGYRVINLKSQGPASAGCATLESDYEAGGSASDRERHLHGLFVFNTVEECYQSWPGPSFPHMSQVRHRGKRAWGSCPIWKGSE